MKIRFRKAVEEHAKVPRVARFNINYLEKAKKIKLMREDGKIIPRLELNIANKEREDLVRMMDRTNEIMSSCGLSKPFRHPPKIES